MEKVDYENRLKQIESVYKASKDALYIEFGLSQAKYKVGDTIKCDDRTILIDKITAYKSFNLPEPVYHGIMLKKDLTPKKNGERDSIYGNHSTELIKSK